MADVFLQKVKTSSNSKDKDKKETSTLLLGRFEVGKLLGHGTFAKVYYAKNIKTDEGVAIKVIDKEKILKGGLVAHIKREISILRRVRHPNIVQLFELFNKVAKGRLKEEVVVYHRDLKPENLLLDENGNLKVSDFGLSAVSDQIRQDGLFHTFCGTPAYVAPEVLARKGYDGAKVDLWSCGVVLFVLMAGYLPFHDQNVMAMYKKIYKGEFRCPRWFSPDLSKLLVRLLDTKPETRIAIPDIMENRWFKKGFKQIKFYVEDDRLCNVDDGFGDNDDDTASITSVASFSDYAVSESDSEIETRRKNAPLPRPASLNAFDIISFSPGFDLSGLFEEKGDENRIVTAAPVSKIISKLEEIAQLVSFTVRKKDCRVSLEGTREGVKGPLTIAAEIFELTPSLVVVEVKKKGGDRAEYERFCNEELKPGLQNLTMEESAPASDLSLESATSSALSLPEGPSLLRVLSEPVHNFTSDVESPIYTPEE
ncbi:CBL-interacting kinase [Medicago truncatula]|uniref:non-specific serine/threonine protein kinase n=1 Tax=Medicago truncatula TaxID=3880 RepID=A0A072V5G9_MEDTR|nr:CBL-interacting kinase [Medicago truncatula]